MGDFTARAGDHATFNQSEVHSGRAIGELVATAAGFHQIGAALKVVEGHSLQGFVTLHQLVLQLITSPQSHVDIAVGELVALLDARTTVNRLPEAAGCQQQG